MKKLMIASLFTASALLSNLAEATAASQMETITVTYRNPLDYALYQYTTELISHYRAEIRTSIQWQAKNNSQTMAEAFFARDMSKQVALVDFQTKQKLHTE